MLGIGFFDILHDVRVSMENDTFKLFTLPAMTHYPDFTKYTMYMQCV